VNAAAAAGRDCMIPVTGVTVTVTVTGGPGAAAAAMVPVCSDWQFLRRTPSRTPAARQPLRRPWARGRITDDRCQGASSRVRRTGCTMRIMILADSELSLSTWTRAEFRWRVSGCLQPPA
jgi:hypothetical protein